MLTGTPLDLTPFGPLLSALGIAYWVVAIGLLGLALWLPKRWWIKLPLALAVAAGFILPVARHVESRSTQRAEWKVRLDESMALFAERCKTAGEKITRTVDNVDGVVWMKWRERISNADNFADQWKLNDPYGQDCGLEGCILKLLQPGGSDGKPTVASRPAKGYKFVETDDPRDGHRYRYTATWKSVAEVPREEFVRHVQETGFGANGAGYYVALERRPIGPFSARYGIGWEDISTHTDREHWIAGGSLKLVDLQTSEVVAERVGYMIDEGQGSQSGDRSPWLFAEHTACPPFDRSESNSPIKSSRSTAFVHRVVRARGE